MVLLTSKFQNQSFFSFRLHSIFRLPKWRTKLWMYWWIVHLWTRSCFRRRCLCRYVAQPSISTFGVVVFQFSQKCPIFFYSFWIFSGFFQFFSIFQNFSEYFRIFLNVSKYFWKVQKFSENIRVLFNISEVFWIYHHIGRGRPWPQKVSGW